MASLTYSLFVSHQGVVGYCVKQHWGFKKLIEVYFGPISESVFWRSGENSKKTELIVNMKSEFLSDPYGMSCNWFCSRMTINTLCSHSFAAVRWMPQLPRRLEDSEGEACGSDLGHVGEVQEPPAGKLCARLTLVELLFFM